MSDIQSKRSQTAASGRRPKMDQGDGFEEKKQVNDAESSFGGSINDRAEYTTKNTAGGALEKPNLSAFRQGRESMHEV